MIASRNFALDDPSWPTAEKGLQAERETNCWLEATHNRRPSVWRAIRRKYKAASAKAIGSKARKIGLRPWNGTASTRKKPRSARSSSELGDAVTQLVSHLFLKDFDVEC